MEGAIMNHYKDIDTKPANTIVIGDKDGVRTLAKYEPVSMNRYRPTDIAQPIMLDVPITATQHGEVKTSAVDRAQGFLIASVPRTFAFALTVTILSIAVGGVTLAASFVILFSVFSVVELISYAITLLLSAEGVSFYEARQKWQVIKREQKNRWEHYRNS